MRVVVQRVSEAQVAIASETVGSIGRGLLVLCGFEAADTLEDLRWVAQKLVNLRIFSDADGLMNLDLTQVGGALLVVSQFTLFAATKKGNRPSFIRSARPEQAIPLYEQFIAELTQMMGQPPQTGRFGADMQITLVNDGPVTLFIDSKAKE
jgi:D-aminoacyl-tRNA deacylase